MKMDKLPEEILLRIFSLLVDRIEQLITVGAVSRHFQRISKDPKLWYLSFLSKYPLWGSHVQYASNAERLIDWKDFCIHLVKQQRATQNFSFQFVKEEDEEEETQFITKSRKRRRLLYEQEQDIEIVIDNYLRGGGGGGGQQQTNQVTPPPFWIQDPLVVDIDRETRTGIVATGKHRKNQLLNRSEHKILFWEYPNWKLKRSFELNLTPPNLTCQIIGIQSLKVGTATKRFFSLAIGMALIHEMDPVLLQDEEDVEDRVDIWKSIYIYQLYNDGSTRCVANIKVADLFLGREIFLFSDTSWSDDERRSNEQLQDWLEIISPKDAHTYNKTSSIFLLAIGPIYERITGCVKLSRFDLSSHNDILDPSITPVIWDNSIQQLVPLISTGNYYRQPIEIITSIKLGTDVSCMIHFKYPTYLNHLICTGSYQDDELSVYDWRFGIKVGTLPWKTVSASGGGVMLDEQQQQQQQRRQENQMAQVLIEEQVEGRRNVAVQTEQEQLQEEDEDEDEEDNIVEEEEPFIDVRPWGLESTLVLPPYWTSSSSTNERYNDDVSLRGFRLIAVGDNRSDHSRDKLEIKVWDISYLLQVKWSPFIGGSSEFEHMEQEEQDLTYRFHWWPRRTKELKKLALNMIQQEQARNNSNDLLTTIRTTTTARLLLNDEEAADNNNMTTLTTTLTTNIFNNHNDTTTATTRQYTNGNTNTMIPSPTSLLPYSPPNGFQSMLLSHTFDKDEASSDSSSMIPVKYTAYNVLYTSLFLLTEDGRVTVMDIESGEITGQVENVALGAVGSTTTRGRNTVRGIDVNVIAGKEVVVTSKEGLLRGIVN